METILKIDNIEKYYGNKSSLTKAIDNISFEVGKGTGKKYENRKKQKILSDGSSFDSV